ncbi:MAG: tyrosine-type recombinase/integrase [Actinomycetota bacterium]|nr:tyrosine-type recombinase/integrase [Actinomycetota bacterium]
MTVPRRPTPRRRFGRLRRLASGRWQAGYKGPDGVVRYAEQTFPTKAMAERWLSLTEVNLMRGEWVAPDRQGETVAEWAQRWLDRSVHWKPSTRAGHEWMLRARTLPRWGEVELTAVTRRDVEAWVAEMIAAGAQPDVLRRSLEPLQAICRLAVTEGALGADPTAGVRLPRQPKRNLTVLTVAQVEALAREIEHPVFKPAGHGARAAAPDHRPDLALAVRLAAYGGPRAGELWALRRRSIDLAGPALLITESVTEVRGKLVVTPPKTGVNRRVPLPAMLREPLAAQLATRPEDPAAWLFVGQTGELVRHLAVYRRHFRPAAARAGVPGTRWHDLRHTCASLLIAQGGHPKAVMERLGHSSITVTLDRYGHLFPTLDDALTAGLNETIRVASCTYVARPEAPKSKNGL